MNKFKRGERVVFVKDDDYAGVEIPKGTLATYNDDAPTGGLVRWVLLDTGQRVAAHPDSIAHAEHEPAPGDPSGRHDLAADFFHAKTGTAASYFTVDLSPDERAPYYAAADAFLAAQPAPEPEPEYENGAVIRTAFSEYHMIAGEFVDIHDGGPLAGTPEVTRMVVIDPAEVGVEALQAAIDGANGGAEARAVLQLFGIEVPR